MNPQELADRCALIINERVENGWDPKEAGIAVTLPKCWKAPKGFPKRKLLTINPNTEERVYWFSAWRLLAWLAGNGLAQVEVQTTDTPK